MSNEVFNPIQVEQELHSAFLKAASRERRSAEQVLRELMQNYIQAALQRPEPAHAPATTEPERRADAVRFAKASTELSGGHLSPKFDALTGKFVRGEVNIEQMLQAVLDGRTR